MKKTLNQSQIIRQLADQRGEKIKNMATKDILEKAKKELADLTGFKSPSAIGFKKEGNELIATIEVIEKASIPDGMDVLGAYEVRVDESGKIISYKRTDLRKRVDTALNPEV
ncbi:MAG: gas vesicle protein GvpO [bacterium]|nr:gas vesicle protein GvpO [bacterium]